MLHHHLGDFLLFFSFFPSIVATQIQKNELCGWLMLCYVKLCNEMSCHGSPSRWCQRFFLLNE